MPTITLTLPRPHEAQTSVIESAARFNVLACGRRWGKTTLGLNRTAETALAALPVGWFSPTYKMLADVWREAKLTLKPVIASKNETEKRIELVTGGVIDFWSLDNPDVARGRKYARVVVDEAAQIAALEAAWQEVLRATLTDYKGDAWFLSTPNGQNFFYRLFVKGQDSTDEAFSSWQMPTYANPHIDGAEVEAARGELPQRAFAQEYLAEFIEAEGGVFRNVREVTVLEPSGLEGHEGHKIVGGVDWGKHMDFTAVSIGCRDCKEELGIDRFNQIDYTFQRKRLMQMLARYEFEGAQVGTLAEENAMGDPVIEELQREGLDIEGFQTTASSKPPLIENLALAIEKREWKFIADPLWTAELEAYEQTLSPNTGRPRYSAPEGMHDDTVIGRALMLRKATEPVLVTAPNPFYD